MTPVSSYLVCATPRSGSTLLCHLLDQTGVAGHPEEYFEDLRHSRRPRRPHEYFDPARHANIIERLAVREMPDGTEHRPHPLWTPETYDRYLAWALEQGTTPNGVFGAKLMWGYLGDFATLLRGIDGFAGLPVPDLLERLEILLRAPRDPGVLERLADERAAAAGRRADEVRAARAHAAISNRTPEGSRKKIDFRGPRLITGLTRMPRPITRWRQMLWCSRCPHQATWSTVPAPAIPRRCGGASRT